MTNSTIDLRKTKSGLKNGVASESKPALAPEKKLLMTEEVAHPALERGVGVVESVGQIFFRWRAPEFDYHPQKSITLFLFGALLCAGGVAALFFKNFLFSILLAISGGLVIHNSFRGPRELDSYISTRGVKIGGRIYPFEDLESFWILYDPPSSKELILQSKKTLVPVIRAPLGEADPLQMRQVLLRFLKEEKHEDSLVDAISKSLGF